jgi:hypothetical protein
VVIDGAGRAVNRDELPADGPVPQPINFLNAAHS